MELSTEQQLQLEVFRRDVAVMSESEAKARLMEMLKQWVEQDAAMKARLAEHLLRGMG
jgi:predicted XRE-type DNA-binding protein